MLLCMQLDLLHFSYSPEPQNVAEGGELTEVD